MIRKLLALFAALSPFAALAAGGADREIVTSSENVSYCSRQVSSVRPVGRTQIDVQTTGVECTNAKMEGRTVADISASRELGVGHSHRSPVETTESTSASTANAFK